MPKTARFGPAGTELWASIAPKYALRADEQRILADACAMADNLALLQAAFAEDSRVMVKGSMGQPVLNPLLSEQKAHQSALAGLLLKLKLPDEARSGASDLSTPARKAATARWSRGA